MRTISRLVFGREGIGKRGFIVLFEYVGVCCAYYYFFLKYIFVVGCLFKMKCNSFTPVALTTRCNIIT